MPQKYALPAKAFEALPYLYPFSTDHNALTRVPTDLPVFGPLFRLWVDDMKPTNDWNSDVLDYELKGQAV